jgi:competence protein ComEC
MLSGTIGTALGALLTGWLPCLPGWPICACALLFAALLARLTHAHPLATLLLGLSLGLGWGQLSGERLLASRLSADLEGKAVVLEGVVAAPPQRRSYPGGRQRQRFPFQVERRICGEPGCDSAIPARRVLLSYFGPQRIAVGDRWRLTARLKRPWGLANPDSFNFQAWLARQRFDATGSVRARELVRLPPGGGYSWYQRWRGLVADRLAQLSLEQPVRGVLTALSNGDGSAIPREEWRRLQRYGLNHLVVISGLHVGLVAAVGYFCGRLVGALLGLVWQRSHARAGGRWGALTAAFTYALLSGFGLPAQRALIMLASVQLLSAGGRQLRPVPCLALALAGVALVDPLASHSGGFWLSFGAVGLIFWIREAYPGLAGWRQLLLIQAVLSAGTGLLASLWFGGVGWVAPLANLVAVPVLSLWLAPLCLLAAVVAIPLPGLSAGLWQLAGLPVAAFFQLADALQGFDELWWLAMKPRAWQVALALLALLWLSGPAGLLPRRLALLLLLPLAFPATRLPDAGTLQVTVFDVGQGLAVLAHSRDATLLYDSGPGDPAGPNTASSVILPYLAARRIVPDVVIASHGDNDHASGIPVLMEAFPDAQLWYGEPLPTHHDNAFACRAGREWRSGGLLVQQWHPAASGGEGNAGSCVLLVDLEGFRVLLPGDIGHASELELLDGRPGNWDIDLLVAPHHGSASSSSGAFLNRARPRHVVFAAGYRNHFGHPSADVIKRYRRRGARVYRTDHGGAVTFEARHGQLRAVRQWRRQRTFYWH